MGAAKPEHLRGVNLTNAKLRSAGRDRLAVDQKRKEKVKDSEPVSYRADTRAIDKDRDKVADTLIGARGYLLWQECRPLSKTGKRQERLF